MKLRTILAGLIALAGAHIASAQYSTKVISYLEVYDLETRTHQVVKEFPFLIEAPNWTPDGKWLVVNKQGVCTRYHPMA